MDPPTGVERRVEEVQHTLRLLVGLLLPCLLLLFLLSCLILLHWRPPGRGRGPGRGAGCWASAAAPPPQGRGPRSLLLLPHGDRSRPVIGVPTAGCRARAFRPGGPGDHPRRGTPVGFGSQAQLPQGRARAPPSSSVSGSSITSRAVEETPVLAPPNSPVTSSGTSTTGGMSDGAFRSYLTHSQAKFQRCGRPVPALRPHSTPFEYGSSLRPEDSRVRLNSANFTASQGPGLDTDFGASAGVSVRILSSDSDGSPKSPLLHRQRLEPFEWDYYDPSYQKEALFHHQPPPLCSKQYWL